MGVVKVISRGGDTTGLRDGFDWARRSGKEDIVFVTGMGDGQKMDTHGGIGIITRNPSLAV